MGRRRRSVNHSTRKLAAERAYLSAFMQLSELRDCEVQEHGEKPDFIITTPSGSVGVEVTTINKLPNSHGSVLMETEAAHARFLKQLSDVYYRGGGEPINVQLLTNGCALSSDLEGLAGRLRALRPSTLWAVRRVEDRRAGVLYLRALPRAAGLYRRWRCVDDSLGWVGRPSAEQVADLIERKAARASTYLTRVPRVHLLIVADRMRSSGLLNLSELSLSMPPHAFEAIYALEYPERLYRLT